MLNNLSKKQITEFRAAVIFKKHFISSINDKDFFFPEENSPIDVIYSPQNEKFQVISVDGGPNKLLRHSKYSWGVNLDEIVNQYVINPIESKYKSYRGGGVSDIILLIHAINKPGREKELENDVIKNQKCIDDIAKMSGFKSIYLVFDISEEVIPIYTRN